MSARTRASAPGGADTRGFTIVVAASNSLDPTLAPGIYRCTGAADDVEINAGIVAAAAVGGETHLLEGTYTLSAPVSPLSNVILSSSGAILNGGAVCHAIDINAQSLILIYNIYLQTTSGGVTAFNCANIGGGCSNIQFNLCGFLQSDNDGVAITSADSDIIIDNSVFGTSAPIDRYGVNCDGNDCAVRDCEFDDIDNDGIFLDANSDGCSVHDNDIHSWVGEPIDDDGDNNVERNKCTAVGTPVVAWNSKGCGFATIQATIDHQAGNGSIDIESGTFTVVAGVISLDAADSSLRICGAGMVVTTLSSSAGTCLDINGGINIQIEDLSVQTTGVGANDALVVRGASGAIVLSNIACNDSGQDAVSIAAAAGVVRMEGLDLSAPGAAGIARYGINLAGDNCKILTCRINNTGDDGIWIQTGAENNIVSLNRISGWVGEPIDWDDPNNTVSHNDTQV